MSDKNNMSPELAKKVSICLRKYADLQSENKRLTDNQEKLASERDNARKEVEACIAVLDGIRDGVIDPEDYEEKVAELKDLPGSSVKTASPTGQTPVARAGIGKVHTKLASSEVGELDPLTAFLLGDE